MTWIQTISGKPIDLLDVKPDSIYIRDIAHALSRLCRFTGHVDGFYSVAQHSVLVSQQLPKELALQGLLHDAVEAYIADVSSPLKQAMRQLQGGGVTPYDQIEAHVDSAIAQHFNLTRPLPEAVVEADLRMLATEARDLGLTWRAMRNWHLKCLPYNIYIVARERNVSEAEFLLRYEELTK
jgi:hypothetical protein